MAQQFASQPIDVQLGRTIKGLLEAPLGDYGTIEGYVNVLTGYRGLAHLSGEFANVYEALGDLRGLGAKVSTPRREELLYQLRNSRQAIAQEVDRIRNSIRLPNINDRPHVVNFLKTLSRYLLDLNQDFGSYKNGEDRFTPTSEAVDALGRKYSAMSDLLSSFENADPEEFGYQRELINAKMDLVDAINPGLSSDFKMGCWERLGYDLDAIAMKLTSRYEVDQNEITVTPVTPAPAPIRVRTPTPPTTPATVSTPHRPPRVERLTIPGVGRFQRIPDYGYGGRHDRHGPGRP